MPPVVPKMTSRVGGGCEGRAYISQTPRDLTVSSPRAVGETGGLSRFPPNGGKVREYPANREGDPMATKSEETLAYEELLEIVKSSSIAETKETLSGEDVANIATSDDEYEEGNESISPNTSYSAGMHTSGDDTDGKYHPLEEVERIMKSLRTASVKEELTPRAGSEVVTTSTKSKKVRYSEDSDCGLYSDGSNDTEDEYNSHEGMRNSSAEFIEESEGDI